jgi:hypothetical protein
VPASALAVAQVDASQLDGFLRPSLEAFEFDVPSGSRRDQFVEVWIQYQLALYEPNGELIVVRDGRVIRVHPDDLERYIQQRRG